MPESVHRTIEKLLASEKPEEIRQGLNLARDEIARVAPSDARSLFGMISTIFYIDPLDRPDLVPVLDEAIRLLGGLGKWIIPVLLEQLDESDVKAQIAIAHTLGRIGEEAIEPLMALYEASTDGSRRAFILYALGKIKSPMIARAARLALEAAHSPDVELRDTATRAIGKFAESIPPLQLEEEFRRGFVEALRKNLADPKHGIRAKSVRSLGKLAKYGHLTDEERQTFKTTCLLLAGKDETFEWDRAYIVQKEAIEALRYVNDA